MDDDPHIRSMEIESLNLSDTDISMLDARLEMTTIIPQLIVCSENCGEVCYSYHSCHIDCTSNNHCNIDCISNSGCNCDAYLG
jgi:hypothetical protein